MNLKFAESSECNEWNPMGRMSWGESEGHPQAEKANRAARPPLEGMKAYVLPNRGPPGATFRGDARAKNYSGFFAESVETPQLCISTCMLTSLSVK